MMKRQVWHVYPGTIGNAGAYIDALLNASFDAGLNANAFVSCGYKFPTRGVRKVFFPVTDRILQRGILLRFLRGVEVFVANLLILLFFAIERPRVNLHMAGPFLPFYFLFYFCRKLKLKVYVTCHDVAASNLEMSDRRLRVIREADYLIVHSSSAEGLLEMYLDRDSFKKVKSYPFPFSDYKTILDSELLKYSAKKFQEILGDRALLPVFLFNSPRESKGIKILLEAWGGSSIRNSASLLIAGKWGSVPAGLKELARTMGSCVVYDSYLSDEEFVAFIKYSSYVLLPYNEYSHSSILVSCAKCEGAVITSDIKLFRDYLVGYDLMFPAGDSESLKKLLEYSLNLSESDRLERIEKLRNAVEGQELALADAVKNAYS